MQLNLPMASLLTMTKPPGVTDANPRLLLIQERLGSSLTDLVAERRTAGLAWNRIARELQERTEIYVTGEALRLWFSQREQAA